MLYSLPALLLSLLVVSGRPQPQDPPPEDDAVALEERGEGSDPATQAEEPSAPVDEPAPADPQTEALADGSGKDVATEGSAREAETEPEPEAERLPSDPAGDDAAPGRARSGPRSIEKDAGEEGQPRIRPAAGPPAAPADTRPSRYHLGPEDQIRISVVNLKEFDATVRVRDDRKITLPILGEMEVGGLTVEEVRARITERLRDGYHRAPQVVVEVAEYNNMKVLVFGFVSEPGELRLTGPTTVLQLLQLVGNTKTNAGSTITVVRTRATTVSGPDGKPLTVSESEPIEVDLDALLHQGDLSQNIELQNGDKIYVPPSSAKVYAVGEVGKPGFYPFTDGMTLSDLLQMAGGLTEFAKASGIKIRRKGLPSPIKVNFKAFMKDGDIERNAPLQEGDIVVVNSSFLF